MALTLEQIKDIVANRQGFTNWKRFILFCKPTPAIVDEIAKLYANQKLDEAKSKSFIFSEGTFDEEDKSFKTIDVSVVEVSVLDSLKDKV